jgi:hypothetical protein
LEYLPYNRFQSNVYSQNGEDGILQVILDQLGILSNEQKWCVEFGSWDGKHLSNTFNLVESHGFAAVYIEGDADRYEDLKITAKENQLIHPVLAFVEWQSSSQNTLDKLLKQSPLPENFDVLSIDIDSYDLDVWDSLENYFPKVVVIEINSSIPPGIVWRHGPSTPGNTFTATINVAKVKGYTLVCHTGNLIFVRDDFAKNLMIEAKFRIFPELLFLHHSDWKPKGGFGTGPNLFAKARHLILVFFGAWKKLARVSFRARKRP